MSPPFADDQFVTALFAELDLATGQLAWHCAGHPAPLLLRHTRVVKALDTNPGSPLGMGALFGDAPRVETQALDPGDRLLLYTDGVVDARDVEGEFFGADGWPTWWDDSQRQGNRHQKQCGD